LRACQANGMVAAFMRACLPSVGWRTGRQVGKNFLAQSLSLHRLVRLAAAGRALKDVVRLPAAGRRGLERLFSITANYMTAGQELSPARVI